MQDTIEELHFIRNLAESKYQAEQRIRQLNSQLRNWEQEKEIKSTEGKTRLGFKGYFIVFVVLGYLIGYALDRFYIQIDAGVLDIIFGAPFALICLPLVKIAVVIWDRQINKKNAAENERNREINEKIGKNNADVITSNMRILSEISSCERKIEEALQTLQSVAPWFPEQYLKPEIVNYVIAQLQTGSAESFSQAIVHYEAGV